MNKIKNFTKGFYEKLLKNLVNSFGKNTLNSLLSGAGGSYGKELRKKYDNKKLDIHNKVQKFISVMADYDVCVSGKIDYDNKKIVLECGRCVFDYLNAEPLSFCSYSESFFREYFNAEKVEQECRENKEEICVYNIYLNQ